VACSRENITFTFYFTNERKGPKNLELQNDVIKNSRRKQEKKNGRDQEEKGEKAFGDLRRR
jgi:hypothetical protein